MCKKSLYPLFILLFPLIIFSQSPDLAKEVTISRTEYGVPHVKANNLKGAAFGLAYAEMEDYGEREVYGGDGWQFAVEFGKKIKAYSILAYGQSPDPDSPHHTDQLKLFTENKMKRVAFSEREIRKALLESYTPATGRKLK